MKVTKKYSELIDLVRNLNATPAEKGSKAEVKLKKIANKIKVPFEEYSEKRDDIRLEHAYADNNGVLETNEKGDYKYTKDGMKALTKDLRELMDQEFEFYQLTFSTEGLEEFKFLAGWVEGIEAEDAE